MMIEDSSESDATDAEILTHAKAILKKRCQRGSKITSVNDVSDLFLFEISRSDQEEFACLFLDTRHQIIVFEILFTGTINRSYVYPRVIIKRALDLNAAAIVLGHNHPSGDPTPSQSDLELTKELTRTLKLVDVVVLDHLVVAGAEVYSFAAHGLMSAS